MRLIRDRHNYWSNTAFADKLRGIKKPKALTLHDWIDWRETVKKETPVRYWLAEKALNRLQNIVYFPCDLYQTVRIYVKNRWITKSHCLTASKKDIPPGEWCDLADRIIYCLFNELVKFVEVEAAHIYRIGRFEGAKDLSNSEAGLRWLQWQSEQTGGMSKSAPVIIELYNWWTDERPSRVNPYSLEVNGGDYSEVWALNDKYEEEDTRQLKRLIDIRGSLWT